MKSIAIAAAVWMYAAATAAAQIDQSLPPPSTLKKLSVEELMDIEVTSVSRRPEKLSDAASAIQVITGDDIRRAGSTSLPEALRLASNLEIAQIDSRQWAITARGFNNLFADKMLVLIDGRTVYTPLFAGVYWDVQDTMLEDLDRIEVISGPGATQWGANAVNGVINITTKNAKDTQGGLLVAEAGTELRDSMEARYGGTLARNVYFRVYAKYLERDDSLRPDGRLSGDAWRMKQAGFRTDWDAPNNSTVTIQGDGYEGIMGQVGPTDIRADGGNLLGRWTHTTTDGSDVELQAYYDHTYRLIPASFTQDIDTYDVDFQQHLALASHDFMWGTGYRLIGDSVVNTPATAFLPPSVDRQWFSAFAQDEITLDGDRLRLTAGTKLEHNDYTGFEIEPSIRAAWKADRRQTIWAAVSRAVRTPSRIDHDLFSPATPPYRIAGGPNVVSEKLTAYEMGYRLQLDPQFAVSLATFYNDYGDLRSFDPINPPTAFPVEESSGLEGRSYGAELTGDWRINSAWRLHAGYTELRAHSEPQPGSPSRATRDSIVRDPNRQISLRSNLDLARHWECDTQLRYVSRIESQNVPGYVEADVRIGWSPVDAWELSLSGENLLHASHPEFNGPGSRREIERAVSGKASWRF